MVRKGLIVVLIASCLAAESPIVVAQPRLKSEVKSEPVSIAPSTAWREMAAAYRAKPFAERVLISVKPARATERSAERKSELLIRAVIADDPARSVLAIEAGQLRLHIAGGVLTAHGTGANTRVWSAEFAEAISQESLAKVLPPLPLPQLELFRGQDLPSALFLLPQTGATSFADAALDVVDGITTVRGQSAGGAVVLTINGATGGLRSLTLSGAAGVMELTFIPVEAGDPQTWLPNLAGRPRASSLNAVLDKSPLPLAIGATWLPDRLLAVPTAESRTRSKGPIVVPNDLIFRGQSPEMSSVDVLCGLVIVDPASGEGPAPDQNEPSTGMTIEHWQGWCNQFAEALGLLSAPPADSENPPAIKPKVRLVVLQSPGDDAHGPLTDARTAEIIAADPLLWMNKSGTFAQSIPEAPLLVIVDGKRIVRAVVPLTDASEPRTVAISAIAQLRLGSPSATPPTPGPK